MECDPQIRGIASLTLAPLSAHSIAGSAGTASSTNTSGAILAERPAHGFFEVHAENYMGWEEPSPPCARKRPRDYRQWPPLAPKSEESADKHRLSITCTIWRTAQAIKVRLSTPDTQAAYERGVALSKDQGGQFNFACTELP